MSQTKYCKLVMVTGDNNNKYYEMSYSGGSSFNVKYGRIESTAQTTSYPISKWDNKYNEKTKKGYRDISHTVSIKIDDNKPTSNSEEQLKKVDDAKVDRFLSLMRQYTDNLVRETYTVKHQDVTQSQVDEAQTIINDLQKIDSKKDVTSFNSKLLELYMVIPRRMGDVRNHLIPNINVEKTLQQEQDNVDALASQVKMYNKDKKKEKEDIKIPKRKSILDLLGIEHMKEIQSSKEIDYLTKQITGKSVQGIFEIKKNFENDRFDKWIEGQTNKATKLVYHGTKCTSVIPILEQGLKIRPTGKFQFTGKAYGKGNYFSEQFATSIGYTDGYRGDSVMLIYEVHIGKASSNSYNDYNQCKKAGYDSYVMSGGNLATMRVAYREEQARIKYIIWLK